jgi:hypothetical protein
VVTLAVPGFATGKKAFQAYVKGTMMWPQTRIGPALCIAGAAQPMPAPAFQLGDALQGVASLSVLDAIAWRAHAKFEIQRVTKMQVLADVLKTDEYIGTLMHFLGKTIEEGSRAKATELFTIAGKLVFELSGLSVVFRKALSDAVTRRADMDAVTSIQEQCAVAYAEAGRGSLPDHVLRKISREWLRPIRIGMPNGR